MGVLHFEDVGQQRHGVLPHPAQPHCVLASVRVPTVWTISAGQGDKPGIDVLAGHLV